MLAIDKIISSNISEEFKAQQTHVPVRVIRKMQARMFRISQCLRCGYIELEPDDF